jgi:hypothetical protein
MFLNHYPPSNPYGEYATSGTSSSPPLYHQSMFSASHFSNDKHPAFTMQSLNMNVNVTMNPVYIHSPPIPLNISEGKTKQ